MNYPNKIKKEYKKVISHSNRGMDLEDLINLSNTFYLEEDIAVIYKKPTPITIVDASFDSHGRVITKAYFKEPSTLDYNGIYKGKYIDFDAKSTQNKTSFPLSNLHEHQYQHMINVINHGGITFLIISMNGEYYYLDGHDIIDFINNNERKSIPFSYIEEKGYIIEKKIRPRLDYIKVIDKIYFLG
jgi:recombination protein U